ncbi:hypothetical protein OSTOST_05582 [Ostertagia ostertagi]
MGPEVSPTKILSFSEIATSPPSSAVYAMMTNHIAPALWLYLKHREFVSYFSPDHQNSWQRKVSFVSTCIGLMAVACLQMSVNFPKYKIPYVQVYSNMLLVIFAVVYVWIHTILSTFVIDANIARLKLLFAGVYWLLDSLLAAVELDDSSSGAVCEWGAYFFMCLFLLTDAYEFRNLIFRAPKLVIPGAPLYNAERMTSSPSPLPRRRELSFTDLPDSTLRVPLVL